MWVCDGISKRVQLRNRVLSLSCGAKMNLYQHTKTPVHCHCCCALSSSTQPCLPASRILVTRPVVGALFSNLTPDTLFSLAVFSSLAASSVGFSVTTFVSTMCQKLPSSQCVFLTLLPLPWCSRSTRISVTAHHGILRNGISSSSCTCHMAEEVTATPRQAFAWRTFERSSLSLFPSRFICIYRR